MPAPRFRIRRSYKEPAVAAIGDPRVEGWETVTTFEDERTAGKLGAISFATWESMRPVWQSVRSTGSAGAISTSSCPPPSGRAPARSQRTSTSSEE